MGWRLVAKGSQAGEDLRRLFGVMEGGVPVATGYLERIVNGVGDLTRQVVVRAMDQPSRAGQASGGAEVVQRKADLIDRPLEVLRASGTGVFFNVFGSAHRSKVRVIYAPAGASKIFYYFYMVLC